MNYEGATATMDPNTNLQELKNTVKTFCEERDWDPYHNPKDLSIGIITEASDLLEHFRFKSKEEGLKMLQNSGEREEVSEEMADVLFFLLRMAQRFDIDLSTELEKKLEKNRAKYPISKSRGSNKKYTEL